MTELPPSPYGGTPQPAAPHVSMLERCRSCHKPMMVGVYTDYAHGPSQFVLFCDRTVGCSSYPTQPVPLGFNLT